MRVPESDSRPAADKEPLANLVRLVARSVGILAVLVLLFCIANDAGIPVYGLVAGAGIGGLAIALVARSALESLMGALNLFPDRPVRVGDMCRYDEVQNGGWRPVGTVESIGLQAVSRRPGGHPPAYHEDRSAGGDRFRVPLSHPVTWSRQHARRRAAEESGAKGARVIVGADPSFPGL